MMELNEHYFIRSPVLDKDVITRLYESENLDQFLEELTSDPAIHERILIASPSLYDYLFTRGKDLAQASQGAKHSLIKYILRMASRAMPYGLFSGITYRSFDGGEQLHKMKSIRFTQEWYLGIVQQIEQQQNQHSTLKLYINPLVMESEYYIFLDTAVKQSQNRIKVRKSKLIKKLFSYMRQPISIQMIIEYFSNGNEERGQAILIQLKRLLKQKIILSELRPSVYLQEDMQALLTKNEAAIPAELMSRLIAIEQLMARYQVAEIGQGIALYKELIATMQTLQPSDRYVVVDLLQANTEEQLVRTEVEGLEKINRFLSVFNKNSIAHITMESFKTRFIDKYGLFNEVALLKVLDDDMGIGLPDLHDVLHKSSAYETYSGFISRKIEDTLANTQNTVELNEEDLSYIEWLFEGTTVKIDNGYDFKLSSFIEDEKSYYMIDNNSFGNTMGSFTGRFKLPGVTAGHYFGNEEYISAEINALANSYSDIGMTNYNCPYRIDVNTSSLRPNSIPLNDLYIGVDVNGLYIRSKTLNKKVLPVSTHLLYYMNFNEDKPIIFLTLIGHYLSNTPQNFNLGMLHNLQYIPRFKYKNIVISSRRWNLFKKDYERVSFFKDVSIAEYVREFIKQNNVEQTVYLLEGDKTLPVRTDKELGIQLIEAAFKNMSGNSMLTLLEAPDLLDSTRARNNDFIVSVQPVEMQQAPEQNIECALPINRLGYALDWSYFIVYSNKGFYNTVIDECLCFLEQNDYQYFFVNYNDASKRSLRIRFRKNTHDNGRQAFSIFLREQLEHEVIHYFSEEIFEPEIIRYGGQEISNLVYQYFCEDTRFFAYLTKEHQLGKIPELDKGMLAVIGMVFDFFPSYQAGREFLNGLNQEKNAETLKKFKSNRQSYLRMMEAAMELYHQARSSSFHIKHKLAQQIYKRIQERFDESNAFYILSSIIHMSLNRHIGVNRALENEIYALAGYAYYNLKYRLELKGEFHEIL